MKPTTIIFLLFVLLTLFGTTACSFVLQSLSENIPDNIPDDSLDNSQPKEYPAQAPEPAPVPTAAALPDSPVSPASPSDAPPVPIPPEIPSVQPQGSPTAVAPVTSQQPLRPSAQPPAPSGSLAVFYTVNTGSESESLPVLVHEVSPYGEESLGAYGKRITWDTNYYAVLATIPAVARSYVLHKAVSPSYATNIIYPITKNGKLYVFRDWNTRGGGEVKDVSVYNPMNANLLQTISLYPSATGTPAIVDGDLFYRSSMSFDLYDKRTGGGELYVYRPGMAMPAMLLDYGDPSNKGTFYGVGDHLLSLRYDQGALVLAEHDTGTGATQRELLSIQAPLVYSVYPGETALYLVVPVGGSNSAIRDIIALRTDGTASTLFTIELDASAGETDMMVDEEAGRVILTTIKNTKGFGFDSVTIYDQRTGGLEENIPLGVFVGLKRPGSQGDQFLFLE